MEHLNYPCGLQKAVDGEAALESTEGSFPDAPNAPTKLVCFELRQCPR